MKKYVFIIDGKNKTEIIIKNPTCKEMMHLFFLDQNITYDHYVLETCDIELLMAEDDHKNDNKKHFYYKNGPSDSCINYVCGRLVLIGSDKNKILELIRSSSKYEKIYKEMHKEVENAQTK